MHYPSSSEYLPYDSDALLVFQRTQIAIYLNFGFMVLVLYDHIITFDLEVERLWTLKWRLPKFLFLASRYIVPPILLTKAVAKTGYPLLPCSFVVHFERWGIALSLVIAEVVLLIRVSALYEHSKIMLRFLIALFCCQIAAIVIDTVFVTRSFVPSLYYEHLPGCWVQTQVTYASTLWIPFACFDGILLVLTLYKLFSYGDGLNNTIKVLARDSVFYFVILFVGLMEAVIASIQPVTLPIVFPSEWLACIAVSRMMFNLRGLVFDDPNGTEDLNLPTLEFVCQPVADGSEDGIALAEVEIDEQTGQSNRDSLV